MIDGSKKRNRQLAFELQNLHVCEKRSNVIGKNVWFIQISSLSLFSLNSRHYSITSSLIIF